MTKQSRLFQQTRKQESKLLAPRTAGDCHSRNLVPEHRGQSHVVALICHLVVLICIVTKTSQKLAKTIDSHEWRSVKGFKEKGLP